MALPVANDAQVIFGGLGYMFMEQRALTGAALTVPDTVHKVSKIGTIKISRKASAATTASVKATSNAGEEIEAMRAFDPGSAAVTFAPDMTITTNFNESSPAHLDFYNTVRGNWYVGTYPLGNYNNAGSAVKMELYVFGQFEDGGDIDIDPTKVTSPTVIQRCRTNSVAITTANNSDTNLSAATATILQYHGYAYNFA